MVLRSVTGQAAAVGRAWRVSQGILFALEKVVLVVVVENALMMFVGRRVLLVKGLGLALEAVLLMFVSLMVVLELPELKKAFSVVEVRKAVPVALLVM